MLWLVGVWQPFFKIGFMKLQDVYDLLKDYTAKKETILETYEVVKPYFEEMYSKKRPRKRFVDFNQGIAARLITDTNEPVELN